MADYISLDAAKDKHCQICRERAICYRGDGYSCPERKAFDLIPAADVRPVVKARWYWDAYKYDWCCGNCFHPADHYIDKDDIYKKPSFKFCPHCGADMMEETDA